MTQQEAASRQVRSSADGGGEDDDHVAESSDVGVEGLRAEGRKSMDDDDGGHVTEDSLQSGDEEDYPESVFPEGGGGGGSGSIVDQESHLAEGGELRLIEDRVSDIGPVRGGSVFYGRGHTGTDASLHDGTGKVRRRTRRSATHGEPVKKRTKRMVKSNKHELLIAPNIRLDEAETVLTLHCKPGSYTPKSFCNNINYQLKASGVLSSITGGYRDLIRYDSVKRKIKLYVPPYFYVICENLRIQKLLGWNRFNEIIPATVTLVRSEIYDMSTVGQKENANTNVYANINRDFPASILFPETADFTRDTRTLYVYSSVVKPSNVGNAKSPILRIVDISPSTSRNPLLHRNYLIPQFFPVQSGVLSKINFRLCNGLGDDFPFQSGGNTTIVLCFRKIRKNRQTHAEGEEFDKYSKTFAR